MFESVTGWMFENQTVVWLSVGVFLLAAEMIVPGVYLLWLGLASIATGIVLGGFPELSIFYQVLTFTAFASVSIYGGYQHFYRRNDDDIQNDAEVNRRGGQYIGRTYSLVTAFEDGRGKVKVGDGQWIVEGVNLPDLPAGAKVKVVAVEGSVFMVEPVDTPTAAADGPASGGDTDKSSESMQEA